MTGNFNPGANAGAERIELVIEIKPVTCTGGLDQRVEVKGQLIHPGLPLQARLGAVLRVDEQGPVLLADDSTVRPELPQRIEHDEVG